MKKIIFLLCFTILLSGCTREKGKTDNIKTEEEKYIQTKNERTPVELGGLDVTPMGWGIKKNEQAPPDVPSYISQMLEKYQAFYIGDTEKATVYLTFDEGYENGYTDKILDVLKANDVKAAFFVTGDYVDREEKLIKRMADEGHIIGNHTENHPSLCEISLEEIEQEHRILDEKIEKITGMKVKYVRPPKGEYNEQVLGKLYNMGYTTVFWSFAYFDWDVTLQKGADYAYSQIMPFVDEGAVLLLHAVSPDNADCLDKLIKDVKSNGYSFGTLDALCTKH